MPLILAIEPDRRQSSKLTMIGNNQQRAEFVVADSVGQALVTLDERVPDLVLVSRSLLPKDDAALGERLRAFEAAGLKVATMMIPVLEAPGHHARAHAGQHGSSNRNRVTRGPRGAVEVCDPTLFGLQVAMSLERALNERPSARAATPGPKTSHVASRETSRVENTTRVEGRVSMAADARPEWQNVLSALRRDLEQVEPEPAAPQPPAAPARQNAAAPPVAAAEPPTPRPQPIVIRPAAVATPTPVVAAPPPVVRQPPVVASAEPPKPATVVSGKSAGQVDPPVRKRRSKSPPPAQDEWGFFDPQQCGLAALRTKLNEISGSASGAKKPA